jgi:hypothetical protein
MAERNSGVSEDPTETGKQLTAKARTDARGRDSQLGACNGVSYRGVVVSYDRCDIDVFQGSHRN